MTDYYMNNLILTRVDLFYFNINIIKMSNNILESIVVVRVSRIDHNTYYYPYIADTNTFKFLGVLVERNHFITQYGNVANAIRMSVYINDERYGCQVKSYCPDRDIALCYIFDSQDIPTAQFIDDLHINNIKAKFIYYDNGIKSIKGEIRTKKNKNADNLTLKFSEEVNANGVLIANNAVVGLYHPYYSISSRSIYCIIGELNNIENYGKAVRSQSILLNYRFQDGLRVKSVDEDSVIQVPKDALITDIWFKDYLPTKFFKMTDNYKPTLINLKFYSNTIKIMPYNKSIHLRQVTSLLFYHEDINVKYIYKGKEYETQFKNVSYPKLKYYDLGINKLPYIIFCGLVICEANANINKSKYNLIILNDLNHRYLYLFDLIKINGKQVNTLSDVINSISDKMVIETTEGKYMFTLQDAKEVDEKIRDKYSLKKELFVLLN